MRSSFLTTTMFSLGLSFNLAQADEKPAAAAPPSAAKPAVKGIPKEMLRGEEEAPEAKLPAISLPGDQVKRVLKMLHQIHQALFAYAQTHDQKFPDGKTSNEALRQLFVAELIDDESMFHFSKSVNGPKIPDGDIGNKANGYAQALEPGECELYYVRGLATDRDDSSTPIIFVRVDDGEGTIYVIVVRIAGNAQSFETKNGIVMEKKGGKMMDILSKEFGVNPDDILAPEPVKEAKK